MISNGKLNDSDIMRLSAAVLAEDPENGWIDPQGQFWSTAPGFHTAIFSYGLRMKFETAAKDGWIMVLGPNSLKRQLGGHNRFVQVGASVNPGMQINDAQRETLTKLGFDPDNPYENPRDVEFRDIYPQGYSNHRIPEHAGENERHYMPK